MFFSFAITLIPLCSSVRLRSVQDPNPPSEWCRHGNIIKYGYYSPSTGEVVRDWVEDHETCQVFITHVGYGSLVKKNNVLEMNVKSFANVKVTKNVCDRLSVPPIVGTYIPSMTSGYLTSIEKCHFKVGKIDFTVNLLFAKTGGSGNYDNGILDVESTKKAMQIAEACAANEGCKQLDGEIVFDSCGVDTCKVHYKTYSFDLAISGADFSNLSDNIENAAKLALCESESPAWSVTSLPPAKGYVISNQRELRECSFTLYREVKGKTEGTVEYKIRTCTYEQLKFAVHTPQIHFGRTWVNTKSDTKGSGFKWCNKGTRLEFYWHGKHMTGTVVEDQPEELSAPALLTLKCKLDTASISILQPVTKPPPTPDN